MRVRNIAPYVAGAVPYFPTSTPSKPGVPVPHHASAPSPVPLPKLLGAFEGEIRFDSGQKIWQMTLELSGKIEGKILRGESVVDISDNGVTVSKTSQKGELTLLKKPSEDSIGILLTPTETRVFQVYYLPERDSLAGIYYEKKSATETVPVGTVRLARRH